MSNGVVIPLMEQQHLDFSYLAGGTFELLTLHTAIAIAPYKSGLFMVRIHELSLAGDANFTFFGYPTLPSNTDGRQFTNETLAPFQVTINSGSPAAPAYVHGSSTEIRASSLLVRIRINQDSVNPGTLTGQFSAALLLRQT